MRDKFTVLSLLEDTNTIKRLEDVCQKVNVSYTNVKESMDFLEDVLEENIGLMIFHTQTDINETFKILKMLKEDSLSKQIPSIIICDSGTCESVAESVMNFPVIALYTYNNWENQVANLIKVLALQLDKHNALHGDLISSEEKNFLDPLTGALNRRGCERSFEHLVGYFASNAEKFSFIMLDIDHFKKVNDTYGHDIGDEVLVQMGEIIKENIRQDDSFVRFGGEEFIVLLSDSELNTAKQKAEKIRQEIEGARLSTKSLSVTASFGLVEYREGKTLDNLVTEADALLYKAKEGGRNQVRFN